MLVEAMLFSDQIILNHLKRELPKRDGKISHNEIVAGTGAAIATVQRSIRRLKAAGFIEVDYKAGIGCTYKVKDGDSSPQH